MIYVLTRGEFVNRVSEDLEYMKIQTGENQARYGYAEYEWRVVKGEEHWNRITLYVKDPRTKRWNKTSNRITMVEELS